MKPPPHNRNVPSHVWDDAVREYAAYQARYDLLRSMGLDDAQADAYIEAYDELDYMLQLLGTGEPDFEVADHSRTLATAESALARMRAALGYPQAERAA